MEISLRQTRSNCHLTLPRITSTVPWKVLGAFFNPNCIRTKRLRSWWEINTVTYQSSSSVSTGEIQWWRQVVRRLSLCLESRCTRLFLEWDKSPAGIGCWVSYSRDKSVGIRPFSEWRQLVLRIWFDPAWIHFVIAFPQSRDFETFARCARLVRCRVDGV